MQHAFAWFAAGTKNEPDPVRRAIALTWLFHLVGDIHQSLHTAQVFTADYPNSDRGGNEICVRVTQARQPMDLHRFWDGVTSSSNVTRLRNEATALRNRQEFQRSQLDEFVNTDFESWAKESYKIAMKFAYQNGGRIGIPRSGNLDCTIERPASQVANPRGPGSRSALSRRSGLIRQEIPSSKSGLWEPPPLSHQSSHCIHCYICHRHGWCRASRVLLLDTSAFW